MGLLKSRKAYLCLGAITTPSQCTFRVAGADLEHTLCLPRHPATAVHRSRVRPARRLGYWLVGELQRWSNVVLPVDSNSFALCRYSKRKLRCFILIARLIYLSLTRKVIW